MTRIQQLQDELQEVEANTQSIRQGVEQYKLDNPNSTVENDPYLANGLKELKEYEDELKQLKGEIKKAKLDSFFQSNNLPLE